MQIDQTNNNLLFSKMHLPLIFYDQLGCGYSKVPKNHKIDWNFQIFLDEFDNLIQYFGLKKFNVLGHSWGGMLALEWITKNPNSGLQKLILFSTLPSTKIWNEEHINMLNDFPTEYKAAILADYKGEEHDSNKLKLGIKLFYKEHVGRRSSELYDFKIKKFPKTNREIYEKMWGKSELFRHLSHLSRLQIPPPWKCAGHFPACFHLPKRRKQHLI
mgnify:CR=1 FL=1